MAAHRRLAAEYGRQADSVVRAARVRAQQPREELNPQQRVREALTFSRDKNFEREAVVDERAIVRDALRRGMGDITYSELRANLNARLACGEFQCVDRQHAPGRQFTTARTIAAKQEILRRVSEGRNQVMRVTTRTQAIQIADQNSHLNRAQKNVLEDVLSSPDRIQGIQGYAGVGKTTVLSTLRSMAEAQGYEVQGLAPTSRAARQLREAGVQAGTLQGFLARSASSDLMPERKHFYFVDESSLASTNQVRTFLERLGPKDRALLIGDLRQHQGVEAGRPFEQLQQAGMRTAKLDEMQSAIGRVLLRKLPEMVEKRRLLAAILNTEFGDIPALRVTVPPSDIYHSYYKDCVFLRPERLRADWEHQRIIEAIRAEGIPCFAGSCSEIYLEKAFPEDWQPHQRLKVAKSLGDTSLMFLVHPTLSEADVHDTANAVQKVLAVAMV